MENGKTGKGTGLVLKNGETVKYSSFENNKGIREKW